MSHGVDIIECDVCVTKDKCESFSAVFCIVSKPAALLLPRKCAVLCCIDAHFMWLEVTIEAHSLAVAYRHGVDICECNVCMTKDRRAPLIHCRSNAQSLEALWLRPLCSLQRCQFRQCYRL